MLVAIDIGNSNIAVGVWSGRRWLQHWRLRSVADKTADEYGIELLTLLQTFGLSKGIERVVIASVVPALRETFVTLSRQFLDREPLLVDATNTGGLVIDTDQPSEVGADRIANAVAAWRLYSGANIVIDMGTATTFDAVTDEGRLLGVVIAPGFQVTYDALIGRAAQLRHVQLVAPPTVLGKNTGHAVQAGMILGYAGLVEGITSRLKAELALPALTVIGTGGLVERLVPHTAIFDHVDPWLTLSGLRLVADRDQGRHHEPA